MARDRLELRITTPVLSIDVELVVTTSRHNLYCLKPIHRKDDRQGVEDKCDKGL